MKKNNQILRTSPTLSLGDLILAVSSSTSSTAEAAAALSNLFKSGQVHVQSGGQPARVEVY
ncbi:MAG: hypothetical protein ACJ8I9_04235 [Chthoniobacterales bacterium]|jgi:hypothetical protein